MTTSLDKINNKKIANLLREQNATLAKTPETVEFTNEPVPDALLRNIGQYPHIFVLGCIMDRRISAKRAWKIPYRVSTELCRSPEFAGFLKLELNQLQKFFRENRLHIYNDIMAECFYEGIQKIQKQYHGDVTEIWRDNPQSATVVRRFLQFHGVGIKIATMAANILARDFKIPMADKASIDISPDVHVKRVFKRLGLISQSASIEELAYCARELNPEYPGVIDLPLWHIGNNWCKKTQPLCSECYLEKDCPKVMGTNTAISGDA